jgi:hypothetical protein
MASKREYVALRGSTVVAIGGKSGRLEKMQLVIGFPPTIYQLALGISAG